MPSRPIDELLRLSVDDRLAAIDQLWESLEGEADPFPLNVADRNILDQRVNDDEQDDPNAGISWPELRRKLETDTP